MKADNEPALISLRDAVIASLPDAVAVPVAVRESESNGSIESGVKVFKGLLLVHLGALEQKIEGHIPSSHPVMSWLVNFASDTLSKYLVGDDGKTGYDRLFRKPVREEGLEFGEQVWWKKQRQHDYGVVVDSRWQAGTWLGS